MNIKPSSAEHSALYTELNELNKIRQQAKDDNPAALRQAAQQFEQLFMSMLMKSMREANKTFGEDNFLNSSQVQFYEEMLDNQMTLELAQSGGMGLADVLVKQLTRQSDVRLETDDKDGKEKPLSVSQAERMLNRAFDSTGNLAANAVLGQNVAATVNELQPTAPAALKSATPVAETQASTTPVVRPQAVNQTDYPARFDTPEQFIDMLMPVAQSVAGDLGVDPKVLLAQAALETGWGKHLIQRGEGGSSHNLFNIKADRRWGGDRVAANTLEFRNGIPQRETAAFRAYGSYEESFRDYVAFLQGSPRYQQALEAVADPYDYLRQLQQAGYATDPRYAEKISNILDGELLASRPTGNKEG